MSYNIINHKSVKSGIILTLFNYKMLFPSFFARLYILFAQIANNFFSVFLNLLTSARFLMSL